MIVGLAMGHLSSRMNPQYIIIQVGLLRLYHSNRFENRQCHGDQPHVCMPEALKTLNPISLYIYPIYYKPITLNPKSYTQTPKSRNTKP